MREEFGKKRTEVVSQDTGVCLGVLAPCGENMISNRKGCTRWVTKAAKRTKPRVRNRRKVNRNNRKRGG